MKKVMLHVSIGMLFVTSAIVYPSQSHHAIDRGTSSSSDSESTSGSNSPLHSPHDSIIDSPSIPRQAPCHSLAPQRRTSTLLLNTHLQDHDVIIYSRENSPNPQRIPQEKNRILDQETLVTALTNEATRIATLTNEEKKEEIRARIRKNCAHLITADTALEDLHNHFPDTGIPATAPGSWSPMREQSEPPQIKIIPASGNGTPQPITPPSSPQNNIFKDPSIENILDDVDASNSSGPKQEQLDKLLSVLQDKNIPADEQKETTVYTKEISELKKNVNKAWEKEKNIRKIHATKKLMKKKEQKVTPSSVNRSYRVIGGLCIAVAIAIAIFYARKLLWQTIEQTAFTPVP